MNCIKIINNNALDFNLQYIKHKLSPKTKLCAVVKDNAYGHGINNVIKTLLCYADYFAVANVSEGKKLRALTSLPIIVLGECELECLNDITENNLEITISNLSILKQLAEKEKLKSVSVHLAIDSGMHRLGFNNKKDFINALKLIAKSKNLELKGLFSHIGDPQNTIRLEQQKTIFDKYYALVPNTINPLVHIANSDTMHTDNTMHCDMVRIGINMYGYGNKNLKPVMSVIAKIVNIIVLKNDDYIGYGSTHRMPAGTKLGVIAIGYGQGFLRNNAQFGSVIINGKLCKIVANICMDMTIVDITKATCQIGDYAIIMGQQGMHSIDANLLATFNKTIPYEILTNFDKIKNSMITHDCA